MIGRYKLRDRVFNQEIIISVFIRLIPVDFDSIKSDKAFSALTF